ncbi:MAG: hypothetical protein ACRDOI_37545, partial [Trebonia sp.]
MRPGVVAGRRADRPGAVDQVAQRVGGLGVQRDHPLGVGLADRDPQPRVAVGIGVQAVEVEP